MWWVLLLEFLGIGLFVVWVLWRLSAKHMPWHVFINVWISWTMALSLVALVPIDLNLAYLRRCITHFDGNLLEQRRHCPTEYWESWGAVNKLVDEDLLQASEKALQFCWLAVYTVCQLNGWIVLTFQQSLVESQHFKVWRRIWQALKENGGFYGACGVAAGALLVVVKLMGMDTDYVISGMMALSNAVCLGIVSILLGYGLVEAPKTIWQGARLQPTLKRALYNVHVNQRKYTKAAATLAEKLAEVYMLRKAVSGQLRNFGKEIMCIVKDCPVDVEAAMLMHPIKGPSIPQTKEEMVAAFLSQLHEIEIDEVFDIKLTEVDRWLAALEAGDLLPKGADVFALQEAFLKAGVVHLGDVDHLDLAVKGAKMDRNARVEALERALDGMSIPGYGLVQKQLINAIIKRNDATLEMIRKNQDLDSMDMLEASANVAGFDTASWTMKKLVKLRTELYQANKKYKKCKKKFDNEVVKSILLEDTQYCFEDLAPTRNMVFCMYNAFMNDERGLTGWAGLVSPVRKQFTGKFGLKLEVLSFVWHNTAKKAVQMIVSVACAAMSIIVLWSEFSVFPGIGELSRDPQEGSVLMYHVCTAASVPPGCFKDNYLPQLWQEPWKVSTSVQWVIWAHLFYICSVLYFSLLRLKIFSLYEVVIGETDAFSLLFNAYAVCRLAPSIAQNYLNMLQEAHTVRQESQTTVFESTFSSMGTIPFTNLTFNEVCPPIIVLMFFLTLFSSMFRRCCTCPRLDGESHKTENIMSEAKFTVNVERRKYEARRKLKTSAHRRASVQHHVPGGNHADDRNGQAKNGHASEHALEVVEEVEGMSPRTPNNASPTKGGWGWSGIKGAMTAVQMAQIKKNKPEDSDRKSMLSNMEMGGNAEVAAEAAPVTRTEPPPNPVKWSSPDAKPKWAQPDAKGGGAAKTGNWKKEADDLMADIDDI